MIRIENLVKDYGQVRALDNISFNVKKGEIVGFLGPNGAGKTTCVKTITGYISATSGRVMVDDMDVTQHAVEVKRKIGYLPENAPLYLDMTPREFLEFVGEVRDIKGAALTKRVTEIAEQVGLNDHLDREIGTLSKGYRQRVGLAQALLHDPPILILDEPTSGLDPNQIVEIRDLIKYLGKNRTVILSTHNLHEVVQTCNRIIIIHHGRIVADGTPKEIQAQHGGSKTIILSILNPGRSGQEIKAVLSRIDDVTGIEGPVGTVDEGLRFKIVATDTAVVRPRLFQAVVDAGMVLNELRDEQLDLEAIFQRLTM